MSGFASYHIKDTDRFNPYLFPEVKEELDALFSGMYTFTSADKENIIICFLKNHSLHSHWLREQPDICRLLTEGKYRTSNIESLFEAAAGNRQFLHSFEEYIRNIEVE